MRSHRIEMRIHAQSLGFRILQQHKAWGCVFAIKTKQLGLCIGMKRKLGAMYLQQAQSLGLCICKKHKAWGCVFATHTNIRVVYLQKTQSLWLCICSSTKLGVVYVQQKHRAWGCVFAAANNA